MPLFWSVRLIFIIFQVFRYLLVLVLAAFTFLNIVEAQGKSIFNKWSYFFFCSLILFIIEKLKEGKLNFISEEFMLVYII